MSDTDTTILVALCVMSTFLVMTWFFWSLYYLVFLWGPARRHRAELRRATESREAILTLEMEPREPQIARERQAQAPANN